MAELVSSIGRFASSLHLARVDSYDTSVDDSGALSEDDAQNQIPTGLLNITLLHNQSPRTKVPFVLPTVGNSTFSGSLPEIGSLAVVGFFVQQDPVILGFLPPGLDNLIARRGVIPNLQPGEVLMQSSAPDVDADNKDQQFVGSSVKLDSYGRYVVTLQDYKLTIGYIFSNEYTPDVQSVTDPDSGEEIFLQEILPNGTQRRVGASGSTIWKYGANKIERIGGDVDTKIEGKLVVAARGGQTYQDKRGNSFGLDSDGNVVFTATTGGLTSDVQGGASYFTGGQEKHNTLQGYSRSVGGDHTTMVGGNRKLVVGSAAGVPNGETKIVLGVLGSSESVPVGAKLIAASLGITLFSGPVPPTGIPAIATPGLMTLFAPLTRIGPVGTDPVITLSQFVAFVTALVAGLQLGTCPAGPVTFPSIGAAIGGVVTGSKTVFASP